MSDPRQQKRLLAVLLVVLAGFATYRVVELTGGQAAGSGRSAGAGPAEAALAELEIPRLNLDLLRREAAAYRPGRDPFRFGPVAAPPPPAPKKPVTKPPPVKKPAAQAVKASAPARPPVPQPPKVSFSYLGSFGPSERRIAVFVRGDEIFNALAGDVLLEKFIVDKIGFESADITFVGFPDSPGTRLEAGG